MRVNLVLGLFRRYCKRRQGAVEVWRQSDFKKGLRDKGKGVVRSGVRRGRNGGVFIAIFTWSVFSLFCLCSILKQYFWEVDRLVGESREIRGFFQVFVIICQFYFFIAVFVFVSFLLFIIFRFLFVCFQNFRSLSFNCRVRIFILLFINSTILVFFFVRREKNGSYFTGRWGELNRIIVVNFGRVVIMCQVLFLVFQKY